MKNLIKELLELTEGIKRKEGGLRQRRTSYSSGRRELLGFRRKRIVDLSSELRGTIKKRKKSKSSLSGTGMSYKGRHRTYKSSKS